MGTGKTDRYLNTKGSSTTVSEFALIHSTEGTFVKTQIGNGKLKMRLASGGHSEENIKLLKRYRIEYEITKTYANGVRVGNIPNHKQAFKREGSNQTWFPKNWTSKDIRKAGEHVASLKHNKNIPSGVQMSGTYKGVRVIVIKTKGIIGTIAPDINQGKTIHKTKRRKKD